MTGLSDDLAPRMTWPGSERPVVDEPGPGHVDDQRDPAAKNLLREGFANANLKAEIEVYAGTMHGWCVLDSKVYNQEQAEKAWGRMLALFKTALV